MTSEKPAKPTGPKHASAHRLLAAVLEEMGRGDDALSRLQQAVTLAPTNAQAHADLGNTLLQRSRLADAIGHFRKAVALKPNYAAAHLGLGTALAAVGDQKGAKESLETAIELEPTNTRCYFHMGRTRRFTRGDRHFVAMHQLAQDIGSLSIESQIYLHFALGKALGDVGDYELSFQHLLQGNRLKRQQWPYMEAKVLDRLNCVRSTFSAELIREKAVFGDPSVLPVFIVGMHRSGSTLVEQILASHPLCFGGGELPDIDALARDICGSNSSGYPEAVFSLTAPQMRTLAARYLGVIRRMSPTAERITDKMPLNFIHTGFIHLLFPNARIIHTRRDPRDTAVSCFGIVLGQSFLGQGMDYSSDLAELGRFYRAYRSLMAHWRDVLPADVMLEVDYEELVEDFERQARRIVTHCGLEWDDACAKFYQNARPVLTASVGQVHQPIYRSSVGRWQRYEKFMRPFIDALEGNGAQGSSAQN